MPTCIFLYFYILYPSLFRAEEYTFWKCGIGSKDSETNPSCNCGISRTVIQPPNSPTAVAIYPGEYLSEAACNAQCKRGPEEKEAGNTIIEAGEEDSPRCAASLYPPSAKSRDLPPVTHTFWKCGLGSKDGCTCGISRIVSVNPGEMTEIKQGEYLSENACNAQCKREPEDKCWVCVEEFHGPWPSPAWSHHFCQHKADAPFSYLGTPGMTQAQCNGKFVCPKLEELPYQLTKYP